MGDDFKPVTRDDVDDLALLPGEFRAFRIEVRDAIARLVETFGNRILKAIERVELLVDDHGKRLDRGEREIARIDREVAQIKAHLETKGRKARK